MRPIPLYAAFIDGIIGAFGLTRATIDAFIGNHDGHRNIFLFSPYFVFFYTKKGDFLHNSFFLRNYIVRQGAMDGISSWAQRCEALIGLGDALGSLSEEECVKWALAAREENAWFDQDNVKRALEEVHKVLKRGCVEQWVRPYEAALSRADKRKKVGQKSEEVGLVLAGNIPLAGWQDVLCIWISGRSGVIKLSHKNSVLFKLLIDLVYKKCPILHSQIRFVERLPFPLHFLIASGKDSTLAYLRKHYERDHKVQLLLRGHANSCAILRGDEDIEALKLLGEDVFTYYGMGCRNVSKLFVPRRYENGSGWKDMREAWQSYGRGLKSAKYHNNCIYQRALWQMDRQYFIDGDFVLFHEHSELASPIGVLYFEYYDGELVVGKQGLRGSLWRRIAKRV